MIDKIDNRKIILQQLLEKSQLFNSYFKNQENINTIMNFSAKRNQILQFGKCQINLPEKVKNYSHKYNSSKIMVLTKNKKQATRLKEKYDQLSRLKQSQNVRLNLNASKTQRTQIQSNQQKQLIKDQQPQQLKRQLSQQNQNQQNQQESPIFQRQARYNNTQIRRKSTKQFVVKNRAISAKVRPQFDLFLKYKETQSLPKYRSSFQHKNSSTYKIPQSQATSNKNKDITPEKQSLNREIYKQTCQVNFQPCYKTNRSQNHSQFQNYSPEKRSNSFLVKKIPSNGGTSTSLAVNKNYQQKLEQERKSKIIFRRQLHKVYNRAFVPPPKISAQSYAIYQMKQQGNDQSGKILATINGKNAQQIASLTKIMTCIIVLQISQNLSLDLLEKQVQIGKFQTNITGTSAQIKNGQIYNIQQLLYGLMLPSGNDASLALGVWGGKCLIQNQLKNDMQITRDRSEGTSPLSQSLFKKYYKKDYINRFIQEMNTKAQTLGMTKTVYANTHGLVNSENKSSAIDIALLCEYVMNNQRFTEIVGTKVYSSTIKYKQQVFNQKQKNDTSQQPSNSSINKISKKQYVLKPRQIKYQNTHYLLHKKPNQYIGIKTGVTTVAGPCLASCIHHKQSNRKFIIVVLDCKNMMMRFKQTQILKRWLYKQQSISMKIKKFRPRTLSMKQQKSQICSQMQENEINSDDEFNSQNCQETGD